MSGSSCFKRMQYGDVVSGCGMYAVIRILLWVDENKRSTMRESLLCFVFCLRVPISCFVLL